MSSHTGTRPYPQTTPRVLITVIALLLATVGAGAWVTTAVMLAIGDWASAAVLGPLSLGILYPAYMLAEDPCAGGPRWARPIWVLAGTTALAILSLVAMSEGSALALLAVPCILVLAACGHSYARLEWLSRDRRYDSKAPELFGAPLHKPKVKRRMAGVDLRDITTPSWAIDVAV